MEKSESIHIRTVIEENSTSKITLGRLRMEWEDVVNYILNLKVNDLTSHEKIDAFDRENSKLNVRQDGQKLQKLKEKKNEVSYFY